MNENKLKHLEFIQGVINRMAQNSFLLKGWTVTLVAALFAFANKSEMDNTYMLIGYVPVAAFWFLDGYFLYQEKLYRKLYEDVSKKKEDDIDFSMNASVFKSDVEHWICISFKNTILAFYLPIIIIVTVFVLFPKIL